jgi:hypothetical protein
MLTGLEVVVAARGDSNGSHERDGGRVRVVITRNCRLCCSSVAALKEMQQSCNRATGRVRVAIISTVVAKLVQKKTAVQQRHEPLINFRKREGLGRV